MVIGDKQINDSMQNLNMSQDKNPPKKSLCTQLSSLLAAKKMCRSFQYREFHDEIIREREQSVIQKVRVLNIAGRWEMEELKV